VSLYDDLHNMHGENASTFWLTGWQRRWRKCRHNMDDGPRVWGRLLKAESRYQLENKFGIYSIRESYEDETVSAHQTPQRKEQNDNAHQ